MVPFFPVDPASLAGLRYPTTYPKLRGPGYAVSFPGYKRSLCDGNETKKFPKCALFRKRTLSTPTRLNFGAKKKLLLERIPAGNSGRLHSFANVSVDSGSIGSKILSMGD